MLQKTSSMHYTAFSEHNRKALVKRSQHCWAQHVVCVWPPSCDVLGVVGSNLTIFKLEPTTSTVATHRNTVAKRTQHVAPNNVGYVALACCDRLAGA